MHHHNPVIMEIRVLIFDPQPKVSGPLCLDPSPEVCRVASFLKYHENKMESVLAQAKAARNRSAPTVAWPAPFSVLYLLLVVSGVGWGKRNCVGILMRSVGVVAQTFKGYAAPPPRPVLRRKVVVQAPSLLSHRFWFCCFSIVSISISRVIYFISLSCVVQRAGMLSIFVSGGYPTAAGKIPVLLDPTKAEIGPILSSVSLAAPCRL